MMAQRNHESDGDGDGKDIVVDSKHSSINRDARS